MSKTIAEPKFNTQDKIKSLVFKDVKIDNLDIKPILFENNFGKESERIPQIEYEYGSENSHISDDKPWESIFSPIKKTLIEFPEMENKPLESKALTLRTKSDDPLKYQHILKYFSNPKVNR